MHATLKTQSINKNPGYKARNDAQGPDRFPKEVTSHTLPYRKTVKGDMVDF